MGNISIQCGQSIPFARASSAMASNPVATAALERMTRHLQSNSVDINAATVTLGPDLTMDPQQERFTGPGGARANWFLRDSYRAPFVVPETV
jgi:hypothetical protein